jgi:hypothetical protein
MIDDPKVECLLAKMEKAYVRSKHKTPPITGVCDELEGV